MALYTGRIKFFGACKRFRTRTVCFLDAKLRQALFAGGCCCRSIRGGGSTASLNGLCAQRRTPRSIRVLRFDQPNHCCLLVSKLLSQHPQPNNNRIPPHGQRGKAGRPLGDLCGRFAAFSPSRFHWCKCLAVQNQNRKFLRISLPLANPQT